MRIHRGLPLRLPASGGGAAVCVEEGQRKGAAHKMKVHRRYTTNSTSWTMTDDDNANARRNESFSTTDEGSDSEGTGSSGRSVETSDDDHQRSYCSHESEGSYSGSETSDDYEDDD